MFFKMWNTFALILQWFNTKQTSDHVKSKERKKRIFENQKNQMLFYAEQAPKPKQ